MFITSTIKLDSLSSIGAKDRYITLLRSYDLNKPLGYKYLAPLEPFAY
jgi:hypothetical protein